MASHTVQNPAWPPEVNGLILALEIQRDHALADSAQAFSQLQAMRLALGAANVTIEDMRDAQEFIEFSDGGKLKARYMAWRSRADKKSAASPGSSMYPGKTPRAKP